MTPIEMRKACDGYDGAEAIWGATRHRTAAKTRIVSTRYDAQEYAELEEAASRVGLTLASYQRVQSLSEPKTHSTRRAPAERGLLAMLLGQIGKIGSNLNQIAREANMGLGVRAELEATLAELRRLTQALFHALGRDPRPDGTL